VTRFLDYTAAQLRFVAVLSATAVIMAIYLVVHAYTVPGESSPRLAVYLGDDDHKLTGVFVVDPNVSPVDSLELLPGIGPVLAERIATYRQLHRFEKKIDITEVKGIGPRLYERIKPYLKIGGR
jgi:DNA uptake protein ComE-like DNA-binding protein